MKAFTFDEHIITKELRDTAELLHTFSFSHYDVLRNAVIWLNDQIRCGGTVYVCGNGGSASQADHLAAELVGRFERERRPLAAVSLNNPATLTAIGNDYGFDQVFSRQLEGTIGEDDVLIALTTSGRSENIRKAMQVACNYDAVLILISGKIEDGFDYLAEYGALEEGPPDFPGIHIEIPSTHTATVQEITLSVIHTLCRWVELELGVEE